MDNIIGVENLYPDNLEEELNDLQTKGIHPAVYHKCELILIDWSNGIEWYDDNGWYKEDKEDDVEDAMSLLDLSKIDKGKSEMVEKNKKKKPSLRLMDLFSVSAFYTKNFKRAFYLQYRVLNSKFTDDENNMTRIKYNIQFSIDEIKSSLDFYPEDIIEQLCDKNRKKRGLVTLTMTTCKRFDLFERTFNSFINACKDIELIDKFLIIDDNSSAEDRNKMKSMYPFIELVEKSIDKKGHPISMNMIKDMVKTKYCFHLEDDHEFFCHRNYLRPAMRIMLENDDIRQVLCNENYGEIASDIARIKGGELRRTRNGKKFILHVHYQMGTPEYNEYMAKLGGGSNTHWPHFSFRPGLFRTDIWNYTGEYKMEQEFERNFAYRYSSNGFKTAFLLGLHHIHIGRTSHDLKAGKQVQNAYTLNDTRQWGY